MLLFVGCVLLSACSPKRGYEAALVLADIAAGDQPSRLKKTTPAPKRQPVSFAVEGRSYRGDIYLPEERALSLLLLVPGAAEEGKDDPRLVAFATTLARARFTVLVPDLDSLREQKVHPGNVRELRDAFAWLVGESGLAPRKPAGMIAFSYASGPAILAAMDPSIREKTGFIMAVGGYYDLKRVLTFFTTGYFEENGRWRHLEPNEYGKWVFVSSNLDRIRDPVDRALLKEMAERKKKNPSAELDDLAPKLHSEGKRIYAFITNRDRKLAPELLRKLPEEIHSDIVALDLANKDLSNLRARLILAHGYEDDIIPYTESISLAAAVRKEQARLFLAEGLAHVDLEPGLWSRFRFWRAVDALLAERDRKPIR